MTYRPRPYLPAVMGPRACVVVQRALSEGDQLRRFEQLAAGLDASRDPENLLAAGEVRSWLASMREAAGQYRARQTGGVVGSAGGTSEPVSGAGGAESGVSPPSGSGIRRVAEVAEELELSESYVKRLCRDEVLSATKSGREWAIDAGSVAEYQASRRRVA